MKKILVFLLVLVALLVAEWRLIMHNVKPVINGNMVYINTLGVVDTYYCDPADTEAFLMTER